MKAIGKKVDDLRLIFDESDDVHGAIDALMECQSLTAFTISNNNYDMLSFNSRRLFDSWMNGLRQLNIEVRIRGEILRKVADATGKLEELSLRLWTMGKATIFEYFVR